MFWVGGNPGPGKSTIVRRLAFALDLPLHPIDACTYDHLRRLGPPRPPLQAMPVRGPAGAADDFERAMSAEYRQAVG
ncbi:hypothetical protein Aab01nite_52940 [Paractinoplanes abujensis]|uniref:Uncharacterized protein n=2 Tax=Paractinoplanes abujensis TaxID=882441 RepID=A0A7W7G111_9ACTN|nr:hypothetical protein [Actinoplanes abujensis]GID21704.1 hypothetical protein Aab01nite_52940 [Actinoplanes abujensis]